MLPETNSSDSIPPPPFPPCFTTGMLPPPPPMLPTQQKSKSSSEDNIPVLNKDNLYSTIYNDVVKKCDILNVVCSKTKLWMYPTFPCLQVGPTCGLAIICMLAHSMDIPMKLADLLALAQTNGFTKQGEMFTVANLKSLCDQVLGSNLMNIHHGSQGLEKDKMFIIDEIKTGAVAFVPYDADFNHDPCLKSGLKAHWALIFGVLEPDQEDSQDYYLLARQGKSNHIGVWKFSELSASNANLSEVAPKRCNEEYVIPRGGIEAGLCNQYLLLRKL